MLAQGFVDQGLITYCAARCLGLLQKVIHQIFFQTDSDARLTAWLRVRNNNSSAFPFAEIVALLNLQMLQAAKVF